MAAISVGVATRLAASIVTYAAVRNQLRGEVDRALVAQEEALRGRSAFDACAPPRISPQVRRARPTMWRASR